LGPRSYAIIEQGMISRLIEAKPEELRVYIEEAAGISKYKERRKETESRIRRTQENLERLTDLRDELGRQLQHLERQAEAAEKYKAYKQEERRKKAELTVLRWQGLDQELQKSRARIRETELELEKHLTERVSLETSLEALRESHQDRNEHFNRAQAKYYEAGADIARIEQSLEHHKERSRQTATELDQAIANQRELAQELEQDESRLASIQEELSELEPEQASLSVASEESGENLQQAEEAMNEWQHQWEDFSSRSSDARRQAELAQSRIQSLETAIEQLRNRKQRMGDEKTLLDEQFDRAELDDMLEQQETLELRREETDERISELQDELQEARYQQRGAQSAAADARQSVQNLRASLDSQQALLDEQLGGQNDALKRWLADQNFGQSDRLATQLQVDSGWEYAVEQVIGRFSQGISVPAFDSLQNALAESPRGLAMVSQQNDPVSPGSRSLADRVQGAGGMQSVLAQVDTAETLDEALQVQGSLDPGRSIITRDGAWLARDWILMPESESSHVGVIERQKKVSELAAELEEAESRLAVAESQLEQYQEGAEKAEQARETAQAERASVERELAALSSRISGIKARAEQIEDRLQRISEDMSDILLQLESQQEQLLEVREEWQEALASTERSDEEKEQLLVRRDSLREALDGFRQEARHDRDRAHQLQLQLQSLHSQRDGLKQTLDRMRLQKERLEERLEFLRESRETSEEPIEDLQMQLEGLLDRRLAEEQKLSAARDALEEIDRQVRERDQGRSRIETRIQEIRAGLEKVKMESQATDIRAAQHLDQLKELDVQLQEVVDALPDDATEKAWSEDLEKIASRIQRLGAINLAAIEEYQVQSERKQYLDSQNEDLMEALETLDTAIRKIDRETRQRFKETFDKVNSGLQALFPKVFGGGNAYLELTGEDLLETGVAIMARPPGKKNSTIHLLSGGEKALTAIALVFSIFQLNPAPFCMLDEVDAPLDDANVGRYANMVKEMSKQVQFIFITHNKIAMEMADQLMGVTMHEPGCSRLVSVDVDEAAALAQA
jgi:chromosome segregation protein